MTQIAKIIPVEFSWRANKSMYPSAKLISPNGPNMHLFQDASLLWLKVRKCIQAKNDTTLL